MCHMMTSDSTYCLIISAYIFLEEHYTMYVNIITDNFSLESVQESGDNDMSVMSIKSVV